MCTITLWSKVIFWWSAGSWLFTWHISIFSSHSTHSLQRHLAEGGQPGSASVSSAEKQPGVFEQNVTGQHVVGTAELPQQSRTCMGQEEPGRSNGLMGKCRHCRRKGGSIIKGTRSLLKIYKALLWVMPGTLRKECDSRAHFKPCAQGAASSWCRKNASHELQLCFSSSVTEQQLPDACCYFCVCCWHRGSYGLFTEGCFISCRTHLHKCSNGHGNAWSLSL